MFEFVTMIVFVLVPPCTSAVIVSAICCSLLVVPNNRHSIRSTYTSVKTSYLQGEVCNHSPNSTYRFPIWDQRRNSDSMCELNTSYEATVVQSMEYAHADDKEEAR